MIMRRKFHGRLTRENDRRDTIVQSTGCRETRSSPGPCNRRHRSPVLTREAAVRGAQERREHYQKSLVCASFPVG